MIGITDLFSKIGEFVILSREGFDKYNLYFQFLFPYHELEVLFMVIKGPPLLLFVISGGIAIETYRNPTKTM